jgi:hypothetical protein
LSSFATVAQFSMPMVSFAAAIDAEAHAGAMPVKSSDPNLALLIFVMERIQLERIFMKANRRRVGSSKVRGCCHFFDLAAYKN